MSNREPINVRCPICFGWRPPILILSCGHSFCLRCLFNLRNPEAPHSICCPTCRTNVEGGLDRLPRNYALEQVLENVGAITEDPLTDDSTTNSGESYVSYVATERQPPEGEPIWTGYNAEFFQWVPPPLQRSSSSVNSGSANSLPSTSTSTPRGLEHSESRLGTPTSLLEPPPSSSSISDRSSGSDANGDNGDFRLVRSFRFTANGLVFDSDSGHDSSGA